MKIKKTSLKKCPLCGGSKMRRVARDLVFTRGGKKIKVSNIERDVCGSCGEEFFDRDANARIDAAVFKTRHAA